MRRIACLLTLVLTTALLSGCVYDPYTGTYRPCCGYYGYYYGYPYGYPYYRYPAPYPPYGYPSGPSAPPQGQPGGYPPPPGQVPPRPGASLAPVGGAFRYA